MYNKPDDSDGGALIVRENKMSKMRWPMMIAVVVIAIMALLMIRVRGLLD